MLGLFRYFLALLVTVSHLWPGLSKWAGTSAVFGFYVVSGYLMTLILNNTYGFDAKGSLRYATNRFLRIFPAYWAVLLIAITIVYFLPAEAAATNAKFVMPQDTWDWFRNLFIAGLAHEKPRTLVPPAWTLDIELFFYAAMVLGLARSKLTVTIWLLASVVYTVLLVKTNASFPARYSNYAAASLPFALGAATYMYRTVLSRFLNLPLALSALLLLAATASIHIYDVKLGWWLAPLGGGIYVFTFSCMLFLISIINTNNSAFPSWWRNLDKSIGDLAYPIFLCHQHVAILVVAFVLDGRRVNDGPLWFYSIVFINLLAWAIVILLDRNVNRLRDKIRGKRAPA